MATWDFALVLPGSAARRYAAVCCTAVCGLFAIAGCGGGDSKATSPTAAPAAPAPAPAAAPPAVPTTPTPASTPAAAPSAGAAAPTATGPAPPGGGSPQTTAASTSPAGGATPANPSGAAAPMAGGNPSPAGNIMAAVPQQALQSIPGLSGRTVGAGGRSNNLGSWKPDDYRHARAENDPRLVAAVAHLGPSKSSSENAARLLVELLKAPAGAGTPAAAIPTPPADAAAPAATPAAAPAAPAAGAAPPGLPPGVPLTPDGKIKLPDGSTVDPNDPQVRAAIARMQAAGAIPQSLPPVTEDAVVAAIITSLGGNHTATARGALKRLLLGELKTALPDVAVTGLAARAILIKPSKDEQDMLLAAAVNNSLLRPGGAADPALQAQLLAAIDETASSEVRAALADAALRKAASADQRAAVMALIMKPQPSNLPAQAKLFNSTKLDDSSRQELERRFVGMSAAAVDQLLGLSSGGSSSAGAATSDAGAGANDSAESATLRAVINGIWSEDVVDRLSKSAEDAEDYADFTDGLQLAVSIPQTAMRTALGELNQECWGDGPEATKLGATFGDLIHDPGALVLVKRIPRKEEPPKQQPRTKRGKQNADRKQKGAGGKEKWSEKEEKARYAWMKATEDFVKILNSRFYAAAQAGVGHEHLIHRSSASKPATASVAGKTSTASNADAEVSVASRAGRFPLELHEGAHIVAEYHMCWPDDLPKRLRALDVAPLAVHYVRMEDTASLYKLNTHYLKQLKGVTSRPRPYGRWMDWMGQGVEHGQDRTVDVMFTRHEDAAPEEEENDDGKSTDRRELEKLEPLTIEILVVEIPEYRAPPSEDGESSKRKWKRGGADKEY